MVAPKKCLGIDIGVNSIKIAELTLSKTSLNVTQLAMVEIEYPAGASRAEKNKITIKALKGLIKSNKISTKEAVFCVPGQTVFVRRFPLPKTSQEQLERIIQYEARQKIPFPIEKIMLEYQISDIKGLPEVDVFLVALKKDVLYDFMDLVNKSGLKPIGISISTLALYNFHSLDNTDAEIFQEAHYPTKKKKKKTPFKFKFPKLKKKAKKKEEEKEEDAPPIEEEEENFEDSFAPEIVKAYVNIGASVTDLSIGSTGETMSLGFTRSIPIGGKAITLAIMNQCDEIDDLSTADRIKKENTVILTMETEITDNINEQASIAATSVTDRIIAELRRSLDYYISQPDGMAVDEIILTGGQARLPNLEVYIEDKMGIPVFKYASPVNDNIKGLDKSEQDISVYPISLGLAIVGLGIANIKVDFLPAEKKIAIKFKRKRGFVALLAGMVAGTIFIGSMAGDYFVNTYRDLGDQYEDLYTKNEPMIIKINAAKEIRKGLKENFDKLAKGLTDERDYPLWRWLDILRAKPGDVLIASLQIAPDGTIQIEGFTEKIESAVNFTTTLNENLKNKIVNDEAFEKGAGMTYIKAEYHDLFKKDVQRFIIKMKFKDRLSRIPPSQREIEEQMTSTGGKNQSMQTDISFK
jgi:Tfp pilus assembly PilM family ATPase